VQANGAVVAFPKAMFQRSRHGRLCS
jgi:hypothetical protein